MVLLFFRSASVCVSFLLVVVKMDLLLLAAGAPPHPDLETKLPLSLSAFWRLAHSEDFYRTTRVPNGNVVNQKVVEVTDWVSADSINQNVELASVVISERSGSGVGANLFNMSGKRDHHQQQLRRKTNVVLDLSSPFGKSKATAVQSIALDSKKGEITYTEVSSVSGFPMMRGDLHGKTTYAVTPSADDPNSILVRVSVSVEEVALPYAVGWLKGRVGNIMRKDAIISAQRYLDAMAKAEDEGSYTGDQNMFTRKFGTTM